MIIFIVAPPRSGTSFLFNYLCYNSNLMYPTNLLKYFRKNYNFGFTFQEVIFKFIKKKLIFNNKYGYTKGLLSPSEYGFFFRDQLNINNDELFNKIDKKLILNLINNIKRIKKKRKIIFKNFFTIKEISYISKKYKNCRWIFIKRNKKKVRESFFNMRKELKKNQRPIIYIQNYRDTKTMVKKNIDTIENLINDEMLKIPKKYFTVVDFNKFIKDPDYETNKIKKKFNI